MSSFAEILRALWAMRPAHSFWQIWITITAAAAICVAVAVGRPAAPRRQGATKRPINLIRTWREVETPGAVAALTLLAVIVAFYIAMTLVWEDFSFSDNPWFTLFTLKGDNVGKPIWPASGRFFPLGFQEFNLVRHFTDTITGYQVLPIVQLLIFSCILLVLDDDLSITARAALVILALLTPSILISFTGLIFPERNVLFFLSCLLLSVKRFGQTQSIAWAVAAVVCAQFMLYYKETAFLLLLGFAAGRLVWRCRSAPHGGWDYDRLWDKESRLDLCLASLAVLFLLYYSAGMGLYHYFGYKSEVYAAAARQPLAEIVTGYIRVDLLAWLFVAIVLGRIYLILRQRAAPSLLWDPLAFGGVACLIGYLYLGLFHVYYLAPVDLIAVLYVGRFAALSWTRMRSWAKIAASVLAFTLLLQYVVVSAFALFQQKNLIRANGEIASVVESRYRSGAGNAPKLFFPFAGPLAIRDFGSYLNYRGVPLKAAADEAAKPDSVVLATPAIAEDSQCTEGLPVWCKAVSGPAPGDLVIVLPDDEASLAEASLYRERGELLLSYKPRPPIPDWLYALFNSLHMEGMARFSTVKPLPDRWMDGSVTLWK